jgi:hypothetical protein
MRFLSGESQESIAVSMSRGKMEKSPALVVTDAAVSWNSVSDCKGCTAFSLGFTRLAFVS